MSDPIGLSGGNMSDPIRLTGGNMSHPVRVGDVVHRDAGPWTPTVHRLLEHLHARAVTWVPRPVGISGDREVVTYVEGTVPQDPMPDWIWTDTALTAAAERLATVHRATVDFDRRGAVWQLPAHEPQEVICHNDFAPYNVVFDDAHTPVGVIDWDTASPGPRRWDLGYLAYRMVPLGREPMPMAQRRRRLRLLCDAYGPEVSPEETATAALARVRDMAEFTAARAGAGNTAVADHVQHYLDDASWLVAHLAEIASPLAELQAAIERALGDRLLGLYVFGSIAIGDFDPMRSDLDLLAVLPSRVTDEELDRLHGLHADLVRAHPDWTDRIETAYFPLDVLRAFRTGGEVVRISPGEPLHRVAISPHWLLDLYTVQEKGIVRHGPPAAELLPPISRDEFVAAARANLRDWPGWLAESRTEGFQSYAVLAVCRNLHAVLEGTQVSKPEGARWAKARYPRFAPLIERSLHRLDSTAVDEQTCAAAADFVRFAIDGTAQRRDRV